MIKRLTIAYCVFLAFFSCNKDGGLAGVEVKKLPPEILTTFHAKDSSYWVLKETATAEEDSLYVLKSTNYMDTIKVSTGDVSLIAEFFSIDLFSTHTNRELKIWSSAVQQTRDLTKVYFREEQGNSYSQIVAAAYPFKEGVHFSGGGLTTFTCDSLIDTIAVNAGTFTNVHRFHLTSNKLEMDQPTHYYFAKGVGLIRKEIVSTGEVWELDRFRFIP